MLIIKYERFIETRKIYRDLTHFVFKMLYCNYLINQVFHLLSTISRLIKSRIKIRKTIFKKANFKELSSKKIYVEIERF